MGHPGNNAGNQWAFTSSTSYSWSKPCLNAQQLAEEHTDHQCGFLMHSKNPQNRHLIKIILCRFRSMNCNSPESVWSSSPLRLPLADHTAQTIILTHKKTDQGHLANIMNWQDVSREQRSRSSSLCLKLVETVSKYCCYSDENIYSLSLL